MAAGGGAHDAREAPPVNSAEECLALRSRRPDHEAGDDKIVIQLMSEANFALAPSVPREV